MGHRPARVHPQPSELAAQAWLQTLAELQGVRVAAGRDALTDWDGQQPLVTLDDSLSGFPRPMAVANCVQIDVWSPDCARELGEAIWKAAAEITTIGRLMGPRFMANQGGRVTLDLQFRTASAG
jgi:hypothetical protein